ncbi:Uncharacterized protein NEOC65_001328 [Neochlamydia sp. AcF65]|uniref:lipoate--protein ligase family protein n=1 Tax=Neochlamydia sp. AcF65 TaxID=2795735 RepID=UPI001BC9FED4|nr:lipoate--protein ligase family protein [Neochlamydia sp. AcF65]MBS4166243.1 Uncharacterized protein [Neochlamydia sp. AcF65]
MKWTILQDAVDTAQNNMDKDLKLLQNIGCTANPILRFYGWQGPCATYGYFINPLLFLDVAGMQKHGLQLGRRPTGGGIVFHLTDLAFSVIIPAKHPCYSLNTLDNYAWVNQQVAEAVKAFKNEIVTAFLKIEPLSTDELCRHFCMAKPTIYDVMVEGKKIGGAAQRRTREGFLHQGTLSIALPDESLLKAVLKKGTEVWEAMKSYSYALEEGANANQLEEIRHQLRHLLVLQFEKTC